MVAYHNDSKERIRVLLVGKLSAHIDARQPATVARVTVIPTCTDLEFRVEGRGLRVEG